MIYGVVLTTARCLGEYGAVAVVSGRHQGKTETATLRVQERYENFDLAGAYAISLVLAAIAVLVLVAMTVDQTARRRRLMSISVRDVRKQFGDFVALDDVSVEVAGGLADGAARPERQRQVDAPARDRRARDARLGRRSDRRART